MRMLILGGTQFLGRTIAVRAIEMGHHVTCAARGVAGLPPPQARFVVVDRDRTNGLAPLARERFDCVVDLSRRPDQVRIAMRDLAARVGHWTFVSTTSVYADTETRGQRADTAPLVSPPAAEAEQGGRIEYGAAKVACEQAFGAGAFLCRPGLIVGPGDPTGRFTYWVERIARGGEVLVPRDPADPVQYIDVRDLACWIVDAATRGLSGTFDAVGPLRPRRDFAEAIAHALGSSCTFTWVDGDFINRHGIGHGRGPRTLPYPMPDSIGDNTRDVTGSFAAGLATRPLAETARDTLVWMNAADPPLTGLTPAEEATLLAAWHAERRDADHHSRSASPLTA